MITSYSSSSHSTCALTPAPCTASKAWTTMRDVLCGSQCWTSACARTCSLRLSTACTSARRRDTDMDDEDDDDNGASHRSVTCSWPRVSVPVLSKMTWRTEHAASRDGAFLIKMPCSAPTPVPTMTAVGVLRPNAHGHATTTTLMHNFRHSINLWCPATRSIDGCQAGGNTKATKSQNASVQTLKPMMHGTNIPATRSA